MIAGYEHFAALARRLQWDEAAIDLRANVDAWGRLEDGLRERVLGLVAGFCVGEASVAAELGPFAAAAGPLAADCFEAQARDERRHARFFERVAAELVPGAAARERAAPGVAPRERVAAGAAVRERLAPEFLDLFEVRLPAAARSLAAGESGLADAVGLYHMVLEGVVFGAGLQALVEAAAGLPGLRRGAELVLRDERWHIGFGARCLQDADPAPETVARIVAEGEAAATAWSDVGAEHAERAVSILRRRLGAIRSIRATSHLRPAV